MEYFLYLPALPAALFDRAELTRTKDGIRVGEGLESKLVRFSFGSLMRTRTFRKEATN